MEAKALAREALRVLDLQKRYFRTRSTSDLRICKAAEGQFRKHCEEALGPPEPTLFDPAQPEQDEENRGDQATDSDGP